MSAGVVIIFVIFTIIALMSFWKLYLLLTLGWDRSPTCLVGKTAIVTGSNTGIGFYTAQDFAKRGARVILACRDPHRAEQARLKIVEATGNQNVTVRILDLGSLSSVRDFAKKINTSEERLDILVNNAGAGGFKHTITPDGLSLLMQVNHFGPYLLTILLLDKLKQSTPSRIVIVSSYMAHFAKLNLNNLNAPAEGLFSSAKDYCNSKLLNILFALELAKKLKGCEVVVNSIHPGVVKTDFFRHMSNRSRRYTDFFVSMIYKTAEEGAQTTIYTAVSKDVANVSGEFFMDCKKRKDMLPREACDTELARKVWDKCEQFVKLTEEEKASWRS